MRNGDSVVSRRFCECNRLIANYLAESAAIAEESVAIVLSVAIDVVSIDIAVESVVVSVVSVFFWQAVAKEIIAITKRADFAKFFMIVR